MRVFAIAINTFKEAIRDRILYNLLFFALLMIGSSILLATLTIGEQNKIIKDLGLASTNLFGVLIAIFLGIGLVSKEIEKKTIYTIVSKPVHRYEFILGKYLGLIFTLLVNTIVMAFGVYLVLMVNDWRWNLDYLTRIDLSLLKAFLLIFIELLVITAVALMFSTFTTSTLAAIFTLSIFVIGHLTTDLKTLSARMETATLRGFLNLLYYFLPNLENFNIKGKVVHHIEISPFYITFSVLYGLLYASTLILLSIIIFQRRNFK